MAPHFESSKSVWAQAMSSPVWNFQGPTSSTEESPSVTVGAEGDGCRGGAARVAFARMRLCAR